MSAADAPEIWRERFGRDPLEAKLYIKRSQLCPAGQVERPRVLRKQAADNLTPNPLPLVLGLDGNRRQLLRSILVGFDLATANDCTVFVYCYLETTPV